MSTGLNTPRLTTVERDAIPSPTTDQLIFNTDSSTHQTWNGAAWGDFGGGGGGSFLARYTLEALPVFGASDNILTFLAAEQDSDGLFGSAGDAFLTIQTTGTYIVHIALRLNQASNNSARLEFRVNGSMVNQYRNLGLNTGTDGGGYYAAHMDLTSGQQLSFNLNLPSNAAAVNLDSRVFLQLM